MGKSSHQAGFPAETSTPKLGTGRASVVSLLTAYYLTSPAHQGCSICLLPKGSDLTRCCGTG
uniref:Uncharacterized protein n=1 Tax=Arundo donax TaxID=35708 RepID=A0A0A8ZT80_ARUDO